MGNKNEGFEEMFLTPAEPITETKTTPKTGIQEVYHSPPPCTPTQSIPTQKSLQCNRTVLLWRLGEMIDYTQDEKTKKLLCDAQTYINDNKETTRPVLIEESSGISQKKKSFWRK
jgi:hypothetical protein